jgi:acetyltransferase-like isoleucine patch superfamily enzyme
MIASVIHFLKSLRKRYYQRQVERTALLIKGTVTVNGLSYVNRNTTLGDNVHFNGMRIIGNGPVTIGNNFHSGIDCVIITQTHNYNGSAIPYDSTYITKPVVIEDNVWLGHGVLILPGVTLGEGCIIQAGAVIVKDIPKLGIAGGNPAKVFKERDAEHYYLLKQQGKFH